MAGESACRLAGALSQLQVNIGLVWSIMRAECSPLGVIAACDALGWIEECSTFGGPVASGSIASDSMLTGVNAKENGGSPYTSA